MSIIFILNYGCQKSEKFAFDEILDSSVQKIIKASKHYSVYDQYPRYIKNGDKKWTCVDVNDWTSGFWPGVLWLAYEYSNNSQIKEVADKFTIPLKGFALREPRDHDIGFMIYCSYGNAYRLTNNIEYKNNLLASADTLATLFNPKVGAIHSWPFKEEYSHNTIIDNMMNLELLFWASKNGGDSTLYDIAVSHARVTQKYLVRSDSAVYHLGAFDKNTGEFQRGVAHQGYADESMWARGQAWGIYGFAICYRESRLPEFLKTSMLLADHFVNRLPKDGIPYWDYDDPAIPNAPKDASAAAIAAAGMLEIYSLLDSKDDELKDKYYLAAVNILKILSSNQYISGDSNDAILKHSTGHHPKGLEIDVPIIYGDYYFLDALLKFKRIEEQKNKCQYF